MEGHCFETNIKNILHAIRNIVNITGIVHIYWIGGTKATGNLSVSMFQRKLKARKYWDLKTTWLK